MATTLQKQVAFLREIDQLKSVVRQSPLLDRSRRENSAEHSWHLAMYALVLVEHAAEAVDVQRVLTMLLLHDIVEIDVGDMPIHGGTSAAHQAQLEAVAAQRLFGMLPQPQGEDMLALWHEFESARSADARFAKALDRFQPLLANIRRRRNLDGEWGLHGTSARALWSGHPRRRAEPVGTLRTVGHRALPKPPGAPLKPRK